ncbi:MAG TPA: SDR family oxidoreductase [Microvirga sp.]|nr:SDR family oxidoreductase [Microvirga sp.]
MKTVLITGCSSGFGLETTRYFLDRGWSVVATMRTPREDILPRSEHLRVISLDVTNQESIEQAIIAAGPIDVLVNNAGIGWLNALEGTPMEITRQTFETNTFGTMAMTQAVLPQFRERRSGTIVNVTSSVTLKPLHLLSAYTASKAAVNAFSEVLALELEPFDVRVRVVLPGRAPETSFGQSAMARSQDGIPKAYAGLAQRVFASWQQDTGPITYATDVAQAIWRAATDPACPMRLPAGADAAALMPN